MAEGIGTRNAWSARKALGTGALIGSAVWTATHAFSEIVDSVPDLVAYAALILFWIAAPAGTVLGFGKRLRPARVASAYALGLAVAFYLIEVPYEMVFLLGTACRGKNARY